MAAPGYHHDKSAVLARLKRIEGQVRGLQRMVENDTYCIDVLTQVSAATRALEGVALRLLDDHLRHGVVIENTYGSVVAGNMIEECRGTAIVLDRDCYGITLSANVIAHNGGGIDLIGWLVIEPSPGEPFLLEIRQPGAVGRRQEDLSLFELGE